MWVSCIIEREPSSAECGTGEKEKKSEVFFFGSRHTQGDKVGVSLGGILGATTTESWSIQGTSYYVIGFIGFQFFCGEIVFIPREWFLNLLWTQVWA